jgi:hypothetical protein
LKRSHHRENDRGGPMRIGNLPKRRAVKFGGTTGFGRPALGFVVRDSRTGVYFALDLLKKAREENVARNATSIS